MLLDFTCFVYTFLLEVETPMSAKPVKSKSIPTRFSEEDLVSIKQLAERLDVTDAWVIRHATQLFLRAQEHAEVGYMVREEMAPQQVAKRARAKKTGHAFVDKPQPLQSPQSLHSGKSASG